MEIVSVSPPHMVLIYSGSCVLYRFYGTSHLPWRPSGMFARTYTNKHIHTHTHTHTHNLRYLGFHCQFTKHSEMLVVAPSGCTQNEINVIIKNHFLQWLIV